MFRHSFDTDESQHLHVAWAWAEGLRPYRDVFDNHTPLFHLLTAPLVMAVGEKPWILYAARFAMFPLFALTLIAAAALSRGFFDRSSALWTAVLLAIVPPFFIRSLEFRTDDLWALLWVAALVALLCGRPSRGRSVIAGLLLGLAFATSLKTLPLVVAASVAAVLLSVRAPATARALAARLRHPLALALSMALPPAAFVVWFAARGDLGPFLYGTVFHNLMPGLGEWQKPQRALVLVPLVLFATGVARAVARRSDLSRMGSEAALVLLSALIYFAIIRTVWPLVTGQDLLPFYPLVVVLAVGSILRPGQLRFAGPLAAVGLLSYLVWTLHLDVDGTRDEICLVRDALALTRPGETLLDNKGETVFRRRPHYLALERVTLERLRSGLAADTIAEDCVAAGTTVTIADLRRFPPRGRDFIERNYLPVGAFRVAGYLLDPHVASTVVVAVPSRYALVAEGATAADRIDGVAYTGPILLAAGRHTIAPSGEAARLALVWASAPERGFSPFANGTPCE